MYVHCITQCNNVIIMLTEKGLGTVKGSSFFTLVYILLFSYYWTGSSVSYSQIFSFDNHNAGKHEKFSLLHLQVCYIGFTVM